MKVAIVYLVDFSALFEDLSEEEIVFEGGVDHYITFSSCYDSNFNTSILRLQNRLFHLMNRVIIRLNRNKTLLSVLNIHQQVLLNIINIRH